MWSDALTAKSLDKWKYENKLGLSCNLYMRIHPIVPPPPSPAWTCVHFVHTRRVRRCGWLSVAIEQLT
jgi:hypothetical protein